MQDQVGKMRSRLKQDAEFARGVALRQQRFRKSVNLGELLPQRCLDARSRLRWKRFERTRLDIALRIPRKVATCG